MIEPLAFLKASAYLKEHYLPHGWFSVATFQEPGWRIEGKKSLGLELRGLGRVAVVGAYN